MEWIITFCQKMSNSWILRQFSKMKMKMKMKMNGEIFILIRAILKYRKRYVWNRRFVKSSWNQSFIWWKDQDKISHSYNNRTLVETKTYNWEVVAYVNSVDRLQHEDYNCNSNKSSKLPALAKTSFQLESPRNIWKYSQQ